MKRFIFILLISFLIFPTSYIECGAVETASHFLTKDGLLIYEGLFYSKVYPVFDNSICGTMENIKRVGENKNILGIIYDGWLWLPSDSWQIIDTSLYYNEVVNKDVKSESIEKTDENFEYSTVVVNSPSGATKKKKIKRCKYCNKKKGHSKYCGRKHKTNFVI